MILYVGLGGIVEFVMRTVLTIWLSETHLFSLKVKLM